METTRIVFRLAALVVESAFGAAAMGTPVVFEVERRAEVVTLHEWRNFTEHLVQVATDGQVHNFVPWQGLVGPSQANEVEIATVLRVAASDQVSWVEGRERRPMLCWPEIPDCRLLTTVNIMAAQQQNNVGEYAMLPSTIYAAAVAWVRKYGDPRVFNECLKYYTAIYWARAGETGSLVFPFPEPHLLLPEANTKAMVLMLLMDTVDPPF